jgi:hypothetical protein
MFIIVNAENIKQSINIYQIRKYCDRYIKFVNDDILNVEETREQLDLMVEVCKIIDRPVDLETATNLKK